MSFTVQSNVSLHFGNHQELGNSGDKDSINKCLYEWPRHKLRKQYTIYVFCSNFLVVNVDHLVLVKYMNILQPT